MDDTQNTQYRFSQMIMLGHFPSKRQPAHALAAFIDKQDRRTLAKHPRGFIRRYVPGEFAPYIVYGCGLIAVTWSGDEVMRVSVSGCRMAAGWREDNMDTGLTLAPVEKGWEYAQEEALQRAGLRPRQAPFGVRQARREAWALEEALYSVVGGYKKMPSQIQKQWAKKNVIPLVVTEEVDGE